MAAMTTALVEFSDKENERTYTYTGHTVQKPKMVLQRRKVPVGNQTIAEDTLSVLAGCVDAAGVALPSRVLFSLTVRRPISAVAGDVTAPLAVFRDIVNSDEVTAMVNGQTYVKG